LAHLGLDAKPGRAKAEAANLDARIAELKARSGRVETFQMRAINWSKPAETNALLRTIWRRIELDTELRPTVEEWLFDPEERQREAERAEAEFEAALATGEAA